MANVVVPIADDVRFGAHDDFRSIGARRWVSMLVGLEEHQAELAHLNFVAVG